MHQAASAERNADANLAKVLPLGRVAQRESTRFTREGSLVRSQPRPLSEALETGPFLSEWYLQLVQHARIGELVGESSA